MHCGGEADATKMRPNFTSSKLFSKHHSGDVLDDSEFGAYLVEAENGFEKTTRAKDKTATMTRSPFSPIQPAAADDLERHDSPIAPIPSPLSIPTPDPNPADNGVSSELEPMTEIRSFEQAPTTETGGDELEGMISDKNEDVTMYGSKAEEEATPPSPLLAEEIVKAVQTAGRVSAVD